MPNPEPGQQPPFTPPSTITSAVPHITSFSVTNPPQIPQPADGKIISPVPPVHPAPVRKHIFLWLIFAVILLSLAVVAVYSFNLLPGIVNPLEQSRLAKDAAAKKYIDTLFSGLSTYYTANSQYPWVNVPDGYSSLNVTAETWFTKLSVSSPSPPSKLILIQGVDSSQTVHICYLPQSLTNISIAKDKCFADRFYQQYSASICVKNHEYLCFP
jgi:hypothetical protein